MFATLVLLFASTFAQSKTLALQLQLDRAGYSCNTADGVWGRKGERALRRFQIDRGEKPVNLKPEAAYVRYFANAPDPFQVVVVTQSDLDAIVKIPSDPAAKAALPRLGYESVKEMFAERGHLSVRALERLNPGVDWANVRPGLKLVLPKFPPIREELAAGERGRKNRPVRPEAAVVRVSITNQEITVFDVQGKCLALFPCSIAANKAKVPAHGELHVTSYIAWPNYTYTPDATPRGAKAKRYVWMPGENCPVGVAWLGLNLPGYGIHGTPVPESVGFTGSHGCFRLANWNAARLYAMCKPGTKVVIEP
jgi:lipoprotein-anchoring transpeptidase ErfK/SrfK